MTRSFSLGHPGEKGEMPATRVGRAWRFARRNLIAWVAHGSQADQFAAALGNSRVAKRPR